ncbi:CASP8 protein, partial [Neodrepanis coruscans]|nr:CASP8 protein [Neodrepanis coruscans]
MNTNFQKFLFKVSEALATDELAELKFLSLDHVTTRKLEDIKNPMEFFEALQEKGLLEEGNLAFLRELLYRIGRIDLLTAHLGSSREQVERELQVPDRAQVSPYRQLLYEIAEDLTPEDVRRVKFLLQKNLPKNKLQDNGSALQVFLEMERNGMLEENDLRMLKNILKEFRADIMKKIDIYEERKNENYSEEELRSPVSVSAHPVGQEEEKNTTHMGVETYEMKNNPHGYCVIFNNYSFKNSSKNREGTIQDGEAVKNIFTWLQFEIKEHMNKGAKDIYEQVKEYSQKDHRNRDCFVCFIFSHGEKDKIRGTDNAFVNIKDLVLCFSGSNCPSLAGKPKLFFIQACQGSIGQTAVSVEADFSGHLEMDAVPLTSIPDQADILVGMSTVEGYVSFRDRENGSVYIQCLCEKMKSLCPCGQNLLTILTEVNKEVGRREVDGWKQMPKITSTLRKQLIFKVPQQQSSEK